ncbi:MAG: SpoIID/LytB domain-containing protein [Bacillota bacterium]|nr:SpoIID/LytB domain-containing protein [Bacillota bacterium]
MRTSRRLLSLLLCLLICLAALPAAAAAAESQTIRVRIGSGNYTQSISVRSGSYAIVTQNAPDQTLATAYSGDTVTLSYSGGSYAYSVSNGQSGSGHGILQAQPVADDARFAYGGVSFRGGFRVIAGSSTMYAVNFVDLEYYLYGVVGREIGNSAPQEALRAQAVASRTYALHKIRSGGSFYDVTNTVSSQVYGGYSAETSAVVNAVDATRGMAILYNGAPIEAVFHSNAGGHTEDIEKVWLSDATPLDGVESSYDSYAASAGSYGASTYSWTFRYTPAQMIALANDYGDTDIGSYVGFSLSDTYNGQKSSSGRVMIFTIIGSNGRVSATKDGIRTLLNLKSTLFTVTNSSSSLRYVRGADGKTNSYNDLNSVYAIGKDAAEAEIANAGSGDIYVAGKDGVSVLQKSAPATISSTGSEIIVINGYGYGHGVGMSQWGAMGMAAAGYGWRDIIEHYYCMNGIYVERVY